MTIQWRTSIDTDGMVRYGLSPSLDEEVYDPGLVQWHSFTLTDLLPDAEYHYQVYSGGEPIGGLIASGTQTVSAMMGAFASWFTRRDDGIVRDALGMGFTFALRAPVRADEPLRIEWEVVAREYRPKHRGFVVTARGTASTPAGVALEAEGTGLVRPPPMETTE